MNVGFLQSTKRFGAATDPDGDRYTNELTRADVTAADQAALIEFLKSLQVLPPGTTSLVVDEHYKPKQWPPAGRTPTAQANRK